jgi:hypothetical protein
MSAYLEHMMQQTLTVFLGRALPPEVAWTSVDPATDQHMDAEAGKRRKDRGIKPGWPDVQFIFEGRFYGIELKVGNGTQSDNQILRQGEIEQAKAPYAICRSVEEVECQLRAWGIPMRAHTMMAQEYDQRREFRLTAPKKAPRAPRAKPPSKRAVAIWNKMQAPR